MTTASFSTEELQVLKHLGQKAQHDSKWEEEEIVVLYNFVNRIYNDNRVDTGCTGCRRETVRLLAQAYDTFFPY